MLETRSQDIWTVVAAHFNHLTVWNCVALEGERQRSGVGFSRFLMVADTVPQHINLKQRKDPKVTSIGPLSSCGQTSTYCTVKSTHIIFLSGKLILKFKLLCLQLVHPLPQLFSLLPVRNGTVLFYFHCLMCHVKACAYTLYFHLTWVCPGSSSRCPEICVFRSGSSSSSPSRSAACRCVFLSKVEMRHCFAWHPSYCNYWGNKPHREPSTCSPTSACSLRSGGWWGFSSSWRHPLLSSWPPPPPYESSHPARKRKDEEWNGGRVAHPADVQQQPEHDRTSRRFCRSFSLSLRILCCSARSARRFSCTADHHTSANLKGQIFNMVFDK